MVYDLIPSSFVYVTVYFNSRSVSVCEQRTVVKAAADQAQMFEFEIYNKVGQLGSRY